MSRYIDADEFVEKIIERAKDLRQLNTKTIGEALDDCKTINPEDFRPKGKWIDSPSDGIWTTTCANCGTEKPQHEHTKYCSDCGAKMEG